MRTPDSFLARLCKTLVSNFTSRKFIMTAVVVWYERADHWANVTCIAAFEKPDQLVAFTSQVSQHRWFLGTVLLGYIGIQTAANFSNTATQATQNLIQNAATAINTKSEIKHTEVIVDESAKNENLRHHKDGDE